MDSPFRLLQVREVWNSGRYHNICGYRAFLDAVSKETGVLYHTATQDAGNEAVVLPKKTCYGNEEEEQTLTLPHQKRIDHEPIALAVGASMKILYADGWKHPSPNENSLVLRLDLGAHRVLFMGDAEAGGRKAPSEPPTDDSIEGKLLACCVPELKADVLIVGHHGSKTSSRKVFLDAVGASVYLISSGPTRYASVTLPDDEVVSELEGRGDVWRTDLEDGECGSAAGKVGPDGDGEAGGCDNVVITLPASGAISVDYRPAGD